MALALSLPVHAGGLDEIAPDVNPCAAISTEGMTDDMLRGWRAMLEMKADECGDPLPLLSQFTDREKLEWAFNGSRIPTPVPLPASALLLIAGVAILFASSHQGKTRTRAPDALAGRR